MRDLRFLIMLLAFSSGRLHATDLMTRYERLSCAVVRVDFDGGSGTGFFVNGTGRMVTVAHVLFERKYRIVNTTEVVVDVTPRPGLKIEYPLGTATPLSVPPHKPEDSNRVAFRSGRHRNRSPNTLLHSSGRL
jgi:hypothetical protein